jgi:hypothetical protein
LCCSSAIELCWHKDFFKWCGKVGTSFWRRSRCGKVKMLTLKRKTSITSLSFTSLATRARGWRDTPVSLRVLILSQVNSVGLQFTVLVSVCRQVVFAIPGHTVWSVMISILSFSRCRSYPLFSWIE